MIFYLTVPRYTAFRDADVPLFVNRTALFVHGPGATPGKRLPRARGRWALDSGGYMELRQHGRWTVTPRQYAHEVRRCVAEVGNLDWAATLDWMTEEEVLARTMKSVSDHQELTIESYLQLRYDAPDLAHLWLPVLQGTCPPDYVAHFERWLTRGVDLRQASVVGVGSVCRRWSDTTLRDVFQALGALGLRRLHGFGVKQSSLEWRAIKRQPTRPDVALLYERAQERGLPYEVLEEELRLDPSYGATTWEDSEASVCHLLQSADSAAWSLRARGHAQDVRLARRRLAEFRGLPAAAIAVEGGVLKLGQEVVGRIDPARAGERPGLPHGPGDVGPALVPTQMLPACAAREAAWTGQGRRPHEQCASCVPWALAYREGLRAFLEPLGCWEEAPGRAPLPPPPWGWHQAGLEAAARAQAAWEQHGPEHFGHLADMPPWARRQAELRRRPPPPPAGPPVQRKLWGEA